jgi:hypothetical protein
MQEERERMQYELIKQAVLREWEQVEGDKKDKIIDTLISKPKSSEEQSYDFVTGYVKCVEKMNMASPALEDLESHSKQSKSSWSRRLNDPIFLAKLKEEIKKKQSNKYSKKKESKDRWQIAERVIDEKISSLPQLKDALSKKKIQYNDEIKTKSPYDDLKDTYDDSINEQ